MSKQELIKRIEGLEVNYDSINSAEYYGYKQAIEDVKLLIEKHL